MPCARSGSSHALPFHMVPILKAIGHDWTVSFQCCLQMACLVATSLALAACLDGRRQGLSAPMLLRMQGGPASLPDVRAKDGVAAVVVKPGAVGGFEAAWSIACWARSRGMQVPSLLLRYPLCCSLCFSLHVSPFSKHRQHSLYSPLWWEFSKHRQHSLCSPLCYSLWWGLSKHRQHSLCYPLCCPPWWDLSIQRQHS